MQAELVTIFRCGQAVDQLFYVRLCGHYICMQTAPRCLSGNRWALDLATKATGSCPRTSSFPHATEALPSGFQTPLKLLLSRVFPDSQLHSRAGALWRCHITADGTKIGKKTWPPSECLSCGVESVPRKARFDRDIHAVLCVKFLLWITPILCYEDFINDIRMPGFIKDVHKYFDSIHLHVIHAIHANCTWVKF